MASIRTGVTVHLGISTHGQRWAWLESRQFVDVNAPKFDVQLASKMPGFGGGFWG
jgi:hypothetical protein